MSRPKSAATLTREIADRSFWAQVGMALAPQIMGRRGGLIGGRVRAQRLSPERRREIAQKAANARWSKS